MNQKELKELIDFLVEKDISEFELQRGDEKVKIKRGAVAHAASAVPHIAASFPAPEMPPSAHPGLTASAPPAHSSPPPATQEDLHIVKSPIVGTFYESPAPGAPPFVKIGDVVEAGQVLCIIEAMKLMNEIESDMAGEIVRRLVTNSQAVEYGQPLFAIRSRK